MLQLEVDRRLGGKPRYSLVEKRKRSMLVPDDIRKSVVFIGYRDEDGIELGGTAFLVSIEISRPGPIFTHLVTAKHNIVKIKENSIDGKVYIRVNTTENASKWTTSEIDSWIEHPDDPGVDVMLLPGVPPLQKADYLTLPHDMFATEEIIVDENIGIGDEVFVSGLFLSHSGKSRNLPIVRIGNIAMMPEEQIRVKQYGNIDAYLIEIRSIGGLSGSPVFVHLPDGRLFPPTPEQEQRVDQFLGPPPNIRGPAIYLLGLIHGHWSLDTSETDSPIDDFFKQEKINQGIAIVVPATNILEVLNHHDLLKQREDAMSKYEEKNLPDMDFNDNDEAYTKEQFIADLSKTSKPKPSSPGEGKSKTSG